MRLIDADAIYPWYLATFGRTFEPNDIRFSMNDIKWNLDNIPTAEPEPKRERKTGKWICEKEMQCSCCGFTCDDPYYLGAANYCPNCGAKMEGYNED